MNWEGQPELKKSQSNLVLINIYIYIKLMDFLPIFCFGLIGLQFDLSF